MVDKAPGTDQLVPKENSINNQNNNDNNTIITKKNTISGTLKKEYNENPNTIESIATNFSSLPTNQNILSQTHVNHMSSMSSTSLGANSSGYTAFFESKNAVKSLSVSDDEECGDNEIYEDIMQLDNFALGTEDTINNTVSSRFKPVQLKFCCVTWNMHGSTPTKDDLELLLSPHRDFDLIAIGSEESLRSIFKSFFNSDKSQWETMIQNHIGNDYYLLKATTLSAIHLVIFVKKIHRNKINFLGCNYVKTGAHNLCGNKGGVGIWFKCYDKKFIIINSHLSAGKEHCDKRNNDFERIMENLYNGVDSMDFTIFMGDLNYRLNTAPDEIMDALFECRHLELLKYDQLLLGKSRLKQREREFIEEEITFMPTFKYFDNSSCFECSSDNHCPAWTDRILYKYKTNNNPNFSVKMYAYNSMPQCEMSDHKPVYGYFEINMVTQ